jgi:hypothetical protein
MQPLFRIARRFASGGAPGNARWTVYTTSPYEQKVMNGFTDEVKKGFIRDGPDYLRDIGPAVVFGMGLVWWADGYFHHQVARRATLRIYQCWHVHACTHTQTCMRTHMNRETSFLQRLGKPLAQSLAKRPLARLAL